MRRDFRRSACIVVFLFSAAVFFGCAGRRSPSAYQTLLETGPQRFTFPILEENQDQSSPGQVKLDHDIDAVWEACIDTAIQSFGIIAIQSSDRERTIVFADLELPENARRGNRWRDRWLMARVTSAHSKTMIDIAFVSPASGGAMPLAMDSTIKTDKGPATLATRLATRFLRRVKAVLGEREYISRLRDARPTPRSLTALAAADEHPHTALLERFGNFESLVLRRSSTVVEYKDLGATILDIADRLSVYAPGAVRVRRVHILATEKVAAYVSANGDLLITMGALDAARDIGELAALVAHEVAHLHLQHIGPRRRTVIGSGGGRTALVAALTVGGALASGMLSTSTPDSVAPEDTLLSTEDVLIGAAVGVAALFLPAELGKQVATDIGNAFVQRFSRKQELEADVYATELLWAAGYDYHALLEYLKRCSDNIKTCPPASSD